jgi:uncharacterized protein YbbC (DUF1343 family)
MFGAPWLDGFRLADEFNALELPGVKFTPFVFLPQFEKHAKERCFGARLIVTDREALRSLDVAAWAIKLVHDGDPERFRWRETMYEFANCSAIDALTGGVAFRSIIDTGGDLPPLLDRWREEANAFAESKREVEYAGYAAAEQEPGRALQLV